MPVHTRSQWQKTELHQIRKLVLRFTDTVAKHFQAKSATFLDVRFSPWIRSLSVRSAVAALLESLARKCIWLILWQTHTPIVHFHDNFGWHFGGVGPVTIFQICIGVHYGDTRKPLGGPEKIQRHPTPHVAGGCDAEIPERRGQRFVRPRDLK